MEDKIFSVSDQNFESLALQIFHFQYTNNPVYQSWVLTLGIDPTTVNSVFKIPFLPISFFKTHKVITTDFQPAAIFESSGTTGETPSRHYVKSMRLYETSFLTTFDRFYGPPNQYAILGLLPSYLERQNSSLIAMVDALIKKSGKVASGFYLHNHAELEQTLVECSNKQQPVILIGVTFALLDFAAERGMSLPNTIILETGGMKGRREEITREEVHAILKNKLGVSAIHSEYGMTELLSQAYSQKDGIFDTAPWMRILLRDEDDPLSIKSPGTLSRTRGVINVIDLANIYSCAFIATDDLGSVTTKGFTVDGRLDSSELRGCSLLTL